MQYFQILFLIVPIVVVGFFVEPTQISTIFPNLTLLLSILSAAVLFRLGRGFPQLEMKHLDSEEIENYCKAYLVVSERMRTLFYVIIFAILLIVLFGYVYEIPELFSINRIFVSIILGIVVFVLYRTWELVKFDVDLIQLQADLLQKSIQGERADESIDKFEKIRSKKEIETPAGYGGSKKLKQISKKIFNNPAK